MSKYNSLRELPSKDITGTRYVRAYTEQSGIVQIHGFPACPECQHTLVKFFVSEQWHCTGCGTVWNTKELIKAIELGRRLSRTTVSIRNLVD